MKTHQERLKVVRKDDITEVWQVAFRWYKFKWGYSYEPLKKDKWILDGLKSWERINTITPKL